jgi:hypothetical protein
VTPTLPSPSLSPPFPGDAGVPASSSPPGGASVGVTRIHPDHDLGLNAHEGRPEKDGYLSGPDGGSGEGLSDGLDQLLADYQHLQRRLATLPVIEQAKGVLIGRFGIDADTAFALLRRWSSHSNVKLRDICRLLVDTAAQPSDTAASHHPPSRGDVTLQQLLDHLNGGTVPASTHPHRLAGAPHRPTTTIGHTHG